MSRLVILAAALVAVAATSAKAADLTTLPVPSGPYDWSGFYLGTQAGWGWATQHLKDDAGLDGDVDLNGDYFGPFGGVQKQWNHWVLGIEVEANWSDIDGQTTLQPIGGRTFGNVEIFGSAGAKVGFAWDRFLLYGTGGLAGAETGTLQRFGFNSNEDHSSSFGWMAGAGVDYALTENVIFGVQYRHYDLGEGDFEMGFVPDRTADTDQDTISGHVTLKFNPFGP